jgi:hypothetical protein
MLAVLTLLRSLDLSRCGPLTALNFQLSLRAFKQFSDLSPLAVLTSLQALDLYAM